MSSAPEPPPIAVVADSIHAALEKERRSGGLRHVLIARTDGLPIAHDLEDAKQAKRVAAMAAAIVGTGDMATKDLGQGRLREATVDAEADGSSACGRAPTRSWRGWGSGLRTSA